MHINEAYEHEPILSCREEDGLSCPLSGCSRTGIQCVNVTAPVVLAPTVAVGTPQVTCQGSPVVICTTDSSGTTCSVTLTQQVCVSIPVRYGVSLTSEEPTIGCAEGAVSGGICGCGCGTL